MGRGANCRRRAAATRRRPVHPDRRQPRCERAVSAVRPPLRRRRGDVGSFRNRQFAIEGTRCEGRRHAREGSIVRRPRSKHRESARRVRWRRDCAADRALREAETIASRRRSCSAGTAIRTDADLDPATMHTMARGVVLPRIRARVPTAHEPRHRARPRHARAGRARGRRRRRPRPSHDRCRLCEKSALFRRRTAHWNLAGLGGSAISSSSALALKLRCASLLVLDRTLDRV